MFQNPTRRQSIFQDEAVLNPRHIPDTVIGREREISRIADALRPLTRGNPPDNVLVHGPPGTGKTTCVNHVIDRLAAETGVKPVTINCWQYSTRPSLLAQLLIELGYATPRKGKPADELLLRIKEWLDKNRDVAVVLDEFDQLDDAEQIVYDLYHVGEDADNELGLILLSNEPRPGRELDPRSQSRLDCRTLEFKPYDTNDLANILTQRAQAAFRSNAVTDPVLQLIAETVGEAGGDCRHALTMLLRAGRRAEQENADTVTPKHVPQNSSEQPVTTAPTA